MDTTDAADATTAHHHPHGPHDHAVVAPERLPVAAYPRILATGFAMGSADIVPGVSGGTIALVLGIYDRLVGSIRQGTRGLAALLRGRVRESWQALLAVDWGFLLVLLAGIGTAIVVLAGLLEGLLESQPVLLSAGFLGLVAGSVVVAADDVQDVTPRVWLVGGVAAVLTFLLLGLRAGTLEDPSLVVYFLGGAVAICAMILPGISGSFLLLLFGLYAPVLSAVDDRALVIIAAVGAGAVVGLALFSTLLHWLLDHHRDTVMAALIGLMVGSLRVLWPWPAGAEGVGDTRLGAPDGQVLASLALLVGAGAAVVVVARIARRATN